MNSLFLLSIFVCVEWSVRDPSTASLPSLFQGCVGTGCPSNASLCLHSYQLHLLSPASSPAWATLLPKGQWAEPNVWAVAAENSSMGGCVCMGEGAGTPQHLTGTRVGQGPKLAREELPNSWVQVRMQRTTTAVWFTALLDSIRNTADPKKIPPTFYKVKKGLFFKICLISAGFVNKLNTDWCFRFPDTHRFPVPLRGSQGPLSCCSLSMQWTSPVSLCRRCVVRLRAQKASLAVKMQASIYSPVSKSRSQRRTLSPENLWLQRKQSCCKPLHGRCKWVSACKEQSSPGKRLLL